jgi:hypothetical protein
LKGLKKWELFAEKENFAIGNRGRKGIAGYKQDPFFRLWLFPPKKHSPPDSILLLLLVTLSIKKVCFAEKVKSLL